MGTWRDARDRTVKRREHKVEQDTEQSNEGNISGKIDRTEHFGEHNEERRDRTVKYSEQKEEQDTKQSSAGDITRNKRRNSKNPRHIIFATAFELEFTIKIFLWDEGFYTKSNDYTQR